MDNSQYEQTKLNLAINYFLIRNIWDIIEDNVTKLDDITGFSDTTYRHIVNKGMKPNSKIIQRLHEKIHLDNDVLDGGKMIDVGISAEQWLCSFKEWYPNEKTWKDMEFFNNESMDIASSKLLTKAAVRKKLKELIGNFESTEDINLHRLIHYIKKREPLSEAEIAELKNKHAHKAVLREAKNAVDKVGIAVHTMETLSWKEIINLYNEHLTAKPTGRTKPSTYEHYKKELTYQLRLLQAVEIYEQQHKNRN